MKAWWLCYGVFAVAPVVAVETGNVPDPVGAQFMLRAIVVSFLLGVPLVGVLALVCWRQDRSDDRGQSS